MTERANDNEGDFGFSSDVWPGLAKLAEECGEVVQVIAKLVATGGRTDHWSGDDLGKRLEEEMGDLQAALLFARIYNRDKLDRHVMGARTMEKCELFEKWHGRPAPKEVRHAR